MRKLTIGLAALALTFSVACNGDDEPENNGANNGGSNNGGSNNGGSNNGGSNNGGSNNGGSNNGGSNNGGTNNGTGGTNNGTGGTNNGTGGTNNGTGGTNNGTGGTNNGTGGTNNGTGGDSANCVAYCDIINANCTGDNAKFADTAACLTACADYADDGTDCSADPSLCSGSGDGVQCRIYHASLAAEDDHCNHAGPDGAGVCN